MEIQTGTTPAEAADVTTEDMAEISIEIIELQANATVTPIDHDNTVSETFSDADGYLNSVDTTTTTSTFDTTKYARALVGSATEVFWSSGTPDYGGSAGRGIKFTTNQACSLIGCICEGLTGGTGIVLQDASHTPIATATLAGTVATFASPQALANATTYFLLSVGGGSWTDHRGTTSTPVSGTYVDIVAGVHNSTSEIANIEYVVSELVFGPAIASTVYIDLPTITGTVTNTELVVNSIDREAGDNVTYGIIDTDTTEDDNLALETKNMLVTVDGAKVTGGQLKINLVPKTTSPTDATPSVRTVCLKLWKS